MDKYQNKYRIASARAQWWDYGWNGAYFITICTKNRQHFFGEIEDGISKLSPVGHFANSCWDEIPKHFPFVKLGEFVVMPNHIHGIVVIDKQDERHINVGTQNFASLQTTIQPKPKNQFGPQSKNLASIIRGFKIGVTKKGRLIHNDFAWQSRFHDHIIRNDAEYQHISDYIINNPTNWKDDKFYTS